MDGGTAAWLSLLTTCLRELGRDDVRRWQKELLIKEREEAILALRHICNYIGDNDWPDDLYLRDIIDKYIAPHFFSGKE